MEQHRTSHVSVFSVSNLKATVKGHPAIDRGAGFWEPWRKHKKAPHLVGTGRKTGIMRVHNRDTIKSLGRMAIHKMTKDLFTSVVNTPLRWLLPVVLGAYLLSFSCFAIIWWGIWRHDPTCFTHFSSFRDALAFSVETQATIGYGYRSPSACWITVWLEIIQTFVAFVMNSFFVGAVFARLSHAQQRARTILLSDSACLSRRDGVLKLMVRVGDTRQRIVLGASIQLYMYVWGKGRATSEGERIPVSVYDLPVDVDVRGRLLLPMVVEHTIDECSPLFGHTHATLVSCGVEIIAVFEGVGELGQPFMTMRSYLPQEINWGYFFQQCIFHAPSGTTRHEVDLSLFHDVVRQPRMSPMSRSAASRFVLRDQASAKSPTPWPKPGDNTLVISRHCVVGLWRGKPALLWRIGDTRGYQVTEANVTATLYTYHGSCRACRKAASGADPRVPVTNDSVLGDVTDGGASDSMPPMREHESEGEDLPSSAGRSVDRASYLPSEPGSPNATFGGCRGAPAPLPVSVPRCTCGADEYGYRAESLSLEVQTGEHLMLRLPVIIAHVLTPESPLAKLTSERSAGACAGTEIVLVAEGYSVVTSKNTLRKHLYKMPMDVKWGVRFAQIVSPPRLSSSTPEVQWARFHDIEPQPEEALRAYANAALESQRMHDARCSMMMSMGPDAHGATMTRRNFAGESALMLGGVPPVLREESVSRFATNHRGRFGDRPSRNTLQQDTYNAVMMGPLVAQQQAMLQEERRAEQEREKQRSAGDSGEREEDAPPNSKSTDATDNEVVQQLASASTEAAAAVEQAQAMYMSEVGAGYTSSGGLGEWQPDWPVLDHPDSMDRW